MPVTGPRRRMVRFEYLSDGASPAESGAHFVWRVVAANNRPLGRCVAVADSFDRSRAAAAELRRRLDMADTRVATSGQRELWAWTVHLDGEAAAVSAHPYLRRIECVRGLDQFLAAVRDADPQAGILRHFGARSLRAYVPQPDAAGNPR